ncbi:MAG TPA: TlpA disulfide reductase family protein [Planctomycetaceae bacterium]|nr:TlpA disulfide reductase family protein [Planctomycetaceae bacterium]
MSVARLRTLLWIVLGLAAGLAAGCGKKDARSGTGETATASGESGGLPTVAIRAPTAAAKTQAAPAAADDDEDDSDPDDEKDDKDDQEIVAPKKGTPEWLVHEATRLMLAAPPKTEDVEILKKHRQERNEKVIQLSQQAIEQVHGDKDKVRLFNAAVHNLMEARLQLALTGDADSIALLYEDAAALFKRDPKSQAAAEGAHTLVSLAYGLAQNSAVDKLRWIREFADQAQRFAEDFRSEERRSLPLLFAAARSCELAGLTAEALECYSVIQKGFRKSPFAARVAPIVKRLKLPGNPPQISGPTLEGDDLSVDDLLGKTVLVVFWSAEAKPCLEQLPGIIAVTRKQSRRGLSVVGVNLDHDPEVVQQFVMKNKIPWPQIFYSETEKRGWNNPMVSKYGIMDIPALWLIDSSGNVVSTTVKAEDLAAEAGKLLGSDAATSGDAAGDAKGPESKPAAARSKREPPLETILEQPHQRQSKKPAGTVK